MRTFMRKSLMVAVTFCGLSWSIPTMSQASEDAYATVQALASARAQRLSTDAPAIPADAYSKAEKGSHSPSQREKP